MNSQFYIAKQLLSALYQFAKRYILDISMRFQNRDAQILQKIYENDGVLSRRHLKSIFWPDKSTRAMEVRLSKLQRNNYISWPTREHQKTMPIPEPVCWLGWRGAQYIAGLHGVIVDDIDGNSKNQSRRVQYHFAGRHRQILRDVKRRAKADN